MKLNFKKIVPVLTGAILLGSTIGFASSVAGASTYPSSFSNAVVVIGSASTDKVAAESIAADLGSGVSTTSLSGEVVKIESSSDKLNVGNTLSAVHPTNIDSSDLPTLLAKKTFQASGNSYDYEQELKLASGLTFTNVKDEDLSSNPVVGVALSNGQAVINYTLSFTKNAESTITDGHMVDFEDSTIEILGKEYTLLNAYNGTNMKLELMGGAVNDILEEGASQDYLVNGKTYKVTVEYIGSDKVQLIVNGEKTSSLAVGDSYTLKDKTEVGVRDIMAKNYQATAGSGSKVEFTLGAEKLIMENGQDVEMGSDTVDGLKAFITGGADFISEIKLQWTTSDKEFISNMGALEMPGLKSFKIQAGELTLPLKEDIAVKNNGDDKVSLTFPFETGTKTFDLMYGNGTAFNGLGKDATHSIITGNDSITFNESANDYFVATYVSGATAESYLLEAKTSESSDINYTSVKDVVTGDYFCEDKKAGQDCKIGSIVLHVGAINHDARTVVLSTGVANTFNQMVSKEGLQMILPTVSSNTSLQSGTAVLQFVEELASTNAITGGSAFNVSLGWTDSKVQVASTSPAITSYEMGDSEKYVAYIASDLATKLSYDKSGDQDFVEIEYHGEEVTGNVWITASDVVAGSAAVVKDTELTSAQKAGDLIVVGGPAINSIAAELLGLNADLVKNQGDASGFAPGMFKIELFEGSNNKLSPTKVALLVAGYAVDDTSAAAKALIAEHKFGTGTTTTTAAGYTLA
jgi:hypothetical protein